MSQLGKQAKLAKCKQTGFPAKIKASGQAEEEGESNKQAQQIFTSDGARGFLPENGGGGRL